MSWSVTLNGRAYTEVNVEGTAYADETNGLPAMFQDFAADAGFAKGAGVTSATNLTPATGTMVFTTDQDASAVSIPAGTLVKAESAADSGKFAIGTVTSFTGTTLTVDVTAAAGAAASDWVIAHAVTPRINRLFETLDANGQGITGAGTVAVATLTATALGGNLDANSYSITNVGSVSAAALAMSGDIAMADNVISRLILKDYSETRTQANTGAAYTIDLENGNVFELTLTGNCTFTLSNPPATGMAGSFTLILIQDATGSRTATWPASVKWSGGSAPTISVTANAIDILTFMTVDGGTNWYGAVGGQDFS